MKVTLELVFPENFHLLCKWHITNKMGDKIGNICRNRNEMEEIFYLVADSKSVDDWNDVNNRQSNRWLKKMYKIIFNRCPSFIREHLSVDIAKGRTIFSK